MHAEFYQAAMPHSVLGFQILCGSAQLFKRTATSHCLAGFKYLRPGSSSTWPSNEFRPNHKVPSLVLQWRTPTTKWAKIEHFAASTTGEHYHLNMLIHTSNSQNDYANYFNYRPCNKWPNVTEFTPVFRAGTRLWSLTATSVTVNVQASSGHLRKSTTCPKQCGNYHDISVITELWTPVNKSTQFQTPQK